MSSYILSQILSYTVGRHIWHNTDTYIPEPFCAILYKYLIIIENINMSMKAQKILHFILIYHII